ncbi:MAG: 2-thiouracil desulfurase family protein [Proteobacteria bacterium]|nr:2-thiouracil desulfurase family protein [Pseudomonadota bacterium]
MKQIDIQPSSNSLFLDGYPKELKRCSKIIWSFFTQNPINPTKADFKARWKLNGGLKVILISNCLSNCCGYKCRYNGSSATQEEICQQMSLRKLLETGVAITSACPELMAGLPTLRPACEGPINGKVFAEDGTDYTEPFNLGAQKVLQLAFVVGASEFIGKSGSPSCGIGIYDGSFKGVKIPGYGVTAALLSASGLKVRCL